MLATLSPFLACDDGPVPQPCSNIPPGGCPIARGVSCADPACEAVYACRPGNVWELQYRCPERDGGSRPSPLDAAVDEPTAPAIDASIDAPEGAFGGPGCPSLQAPDCALGLALSCGQGCCGCEDLFVCEDGAWTLWGVCSDGGIHADP
jgi:hypothetical protein